MDPDANLKTQLEIVKTINTLVDAIEYEATPEDTDTLADLAVELAAHVEALDEWIRKGGYLPAAWRPAAADTSTDDDPNDRPCSDPDGHVWGNTSDDGESGASYCIWCGVSGDV